MSNKSASSNTAEKSGFLSFFYEVTRDSVSSWMAHKAPKMGAALAYYTAFSLAPLIVLVLSLVSLFMKRDDAVQRIVVQISDLVGAEGGKVVNEILSHAGSTSALSWSTVMSFVVLWISASGAFGEIQDSLNTIWEVPAQKHPWLNLIKERLLSLSMVFVLGFFMITSLMASAFISGMSETWGLSGSKVAFQFVNTLVSWVVFTGLFSVVYRMLPDIPLKWSDVFPGALVSATLFIIGKYLLGWYIAHSAFASSYGAAGSFVVILFWVFYSAQILYFGAEFSRAYTLKRLPRRS
jgi:membrane protein